METKFLDKLKRIKRGPAIMIQKDVGVILSNSSIDKDSKVLDAGAGCGVLTANLARFVKKVYSYDNRKEFLSIAKENIEKFGLKNVTFKNKDVYEEIKEKNLDLITLDVKEPWLAFENAFNALKENGDLICYSPQITQVMRIVEESEKKFKVVKVLENIEREWMIEGVKVRPKNMIIGHTGFLTILRKNASKN
ncbi:MAG: tRNA methyltransferase [Nanoarchaeota archaeon]|nr:tRNA methyltransferase [Nanoarchaeota archaeon]|tara:strand:+ start:466 stop:1044 length:579 start_codon:yes stop_codon:yes gene_type:complete